MMPIAFSSQSRLSKFRADAMVARGVVIQSLRL
jgi:hypothetical protein